uniref:Uncharacterized protein n=1 Tax=Setaria digitata TaxID=48799 RepID=A0A915PLW2_9BILA
MIAQDKFIRVGGVEVADAAIILNILEEIQKEVDDPKYEEKRRILAGMFRDTE